MQMTVGTIRLGTRIFNAGLPTDPAAIHLHGLHDGMAFGVGQSPEEGDLIVLRQPPFKPEPFFVLAAHQVEGFADTAKVWIGKVESLLKLNSVDRA